MFCERVKMLAVEEPQMYILRPFFKESASGPDPDIEVWWLKTEE